MELLPVRTQAGQLAIHQVGIVQRGIDEGPALAIQTIQIGLVDDLVTLAVGGGLAAQPGTRIGDEGVELDGLGAVDGNGTGGIDGYVVASQPRRIQRHATEAAVAACHAQVHSRTAVQCQHTLARVDLDHRTIGCVDGLAIAVLAQHVGTGVQHGGTTYGDAVGSGQTDAAGLLATGIDGAIDDQLTVVKRHRYVVRLEFITNAQVTFADAEAAAATDATGIEASIEPGKIRDEAPLQIDTPGQERNLGAASIVVPAAAAQQLPEQADGAVFGKGGQLPAAVEQSRQIDLRACRLGDPTCATVQHHIAAPAVLAGIEEIDTTTGQIQARAIGKRHIPLRRQRQLAAGQQHRGIHHQGTVAAVQGNLRAQGRSQRCVVRRDRFAIATYMDITAGGDLVDRTRAAGQHRRADEQITALAVIGLGRCVPVALRFEYRQRALVVGGHALACVQMHRGKAQCQPILRTHGIRL
ncbi:hypothetical protein D3C81_469490 [compost metagenome]